jgi:hypothetical protein
MKAEHEIRCNLSNTLSRFEELLKACAKSRFAVMYK